MSSLIEQAAKRLEELRRAGVEIPGPDGFSPSRFQDSHWPADAAPGALPQPPAARSPVIMLQPGAVPLRSGTAAGEMPGGGATKLHTVGPQAAAVPASEAAPAAPTRPAAPVRRLEIDLARMAAMGYLVPSQAQSLLADLLRVIKRPLLQNMRRPPDAGGPARRANVIVVTSAVPGEGKTFVATNLAMSIAMEVDHAVMLIDGDVLRPSVFARLDLEPQTGLMDVLVDRRQPASEVIVETNVPKLSLMSAGTAHDRAEELLASAAMDRLLDELSARFHDHVIVIDSPPLLVTTESRALAERAGQVVLVVEADRTPREQVSRAFETLANCPIVLSVLNKSRAIESDYVYGY